MVWLPWCLLWLFGLHAAIDCVCTLLCLFVTLQQQNRVTHFLATMYPSIFLEEAASPRLARFMMYWVAAMSLVRALTVCVPTPELFAAVGIMYVLEALVAEYEGFTAQSIHQETARSISLFSLTIALLSVVVCLSEWWIGT